MLDQAVNLLVMAGFIKGVLCGLAIGSAGGFIFGFFKGKKHV